MLQISGLSVRFGGIVALDEVSFEVERGQIVGLIGPNGAGKTTLFNCLNRLYRFERGRIVFEGHSLARVAKHHIARLGIARTFQNLALFHTMTVLQNVMLGGHCRTRSGYGQISLGHGAFYAIGAYCAAILMEQFGVPYWLCIPAAGFVSLTTGFAFGLPALRLEGPYLALATFALAVATPQLLKYDRLEPWTGGVQGIVVTKPNPPSWLPLDQDQWLYFFTLAVVVSMFAGGAKLLAGRIGRAMVAIRDHPIAAQAMGVNISLVKSMTFGVSAMYTGVAGALGAIAVQFVAPDSFTLFLSIVLLASAVIGGLTSTSGAFYGAMFIQFVPHMADQISKAAPWAVYGALLIVFMLFQTLGTACNTAIQKY